MKILSDDGTQFDTIEACLAHEATLPYLKLFAEVATAVDQDAAFAAKIEALGFRLRRERYERGEKRERKAKPLDPPASSETTPKQSSESGDGSSQSRLDVHEDEGGTSDFSTRNEAAE